MNETVIVAIAGAVGGLITGVVAAYLKIAADRRVGQAEQHKLKTEEHGTTFQEFTVLIDLHEKNNATLRAENDALRAEMKAMRGRKDLLIAKASDCYQKLSAAQECIARYEEKLAEHKIPFKPWVPRDGGDSAAEMETQQ